LSRHDSDNHNSISHVSVDFDIVDKWFIEEDENESASTDTHQPTPHHRRGKKRNFGQIEPDSTPTTSANKKRKAVKAEINESGEDKNESTCRVCRQPGKLLCCEGCPAVYHHRCLRPRPNKQWIEKFEWFCPSCAPSKQRIPLRFKNGHKKWPKNEEPLLCELNDFLGKHPELERDLDIEK